MHDYHLGNLGCVWMIVVARLLLIHEILRDRDHAIWVILVACG